MPPHRIKPLTPQRARALLRAAVVAGTIEKPEQCSGCGGIPPQGKDGRSLLQGHHHNGYEDPYDVVWLCSECHGPEDFGQARGEANGGTMYSDAFVLDILQQMKDGVSVKHLTLYTGIGVTTLRNWKRGIYRKDLQCLVR